MTIPTDAIQLNQVNRVLAIKFRNLGDVLLTTPIFTFLRQELGSNAIIDALVYEDCQPLLLNNPDINTIHTSKRGASGLSAIFQDIRQWLDIRKKNYDLIINLTEGDRGTLVTKFSGSKWSIGLSHPSTLSKSWKKNSYTHLYKIGSRPRHTVEQGLDAMRRIGCNIPYKSVATKMNLLDKEKESATTTLIDNGWGKNNYVVLHPTSRWLFKSLLTEQIVELLHALEKYELEIVITSSPDQQELNIIEKVLKQYNGKTINLAGKISLRELACIVDEAEFILGADSVPIHIAAAVNTPAIVWFGPSGDKTWHPWLVKHKIISMPYDCRPCGLDGCGGGKRSICLTDIPNSKFVEAIEEITAS